MDKPTPQDLLRETLDDYLTAKTEEDRRFFAREALSLVRFRNATCSDATRTEIEGAAR